MNYAYTRASRLIQEVSCAVQEDMIRTYAVSIGQTIDKVLVDEDTSAKVFPFAKRDGGGWLMHAVQEGDRVFFSKIDRLSRRTIDTLTVLKAFDKKNVKVHVVDFGGRSLDLEDPMSFALVSFMAVFAEVEAKRISERTKEALKYRRDRGMPVNAHSPYGMRRKKRRRSSGGYQAYDEWDSQECQDIREIYRRVAENHESVYRVAIDFAKQGRLTAKDKLWAKPPKREGRPWRDDRVRRTYCWYFCLRELGLDVETAPVAAVAMFSSAWRQAGMPRTIAQWRSADPEGLREFVELATKSVA